MTKIIINTAKEILPEEKQILKNIFREESLEIKINTSFMRFSEVEILPLVIELSVIAFEVVLGGIAYDTLKRIVKKILSNRGIKRNKEIIIKKREKTFIVTSKGFYLRSKKENSVFRNIDEFFKKMEKGK